MMRISFKCLQNIIAQLGDGEKPGYVTEPSLLAGALRLVLPLLYGYAPLTSTTPNFHVPDVRKN